MRRLSSLLIFCLIAPLLWAWGGDASTPARRDVRTFILETLRKQQGDTWDRVGQFMLWSYRFDRSGCELTVQREAELSDQFRQTIPITLAPLAGAQGSELVFACRDREPCIQYNINNRDVVDEQQVRQARVLVMDSRDITPLMNAFAELYQLCRDPYAPR